MPIIPAGVPPWVRTNDLTHYGGHTDKQNFLGRGAIDALTDVDAEEFARLASDIAALQRVADFCQLTLVCSDSSPAAPTFELVNMMTGVRTVSYVGDAAPSGFPSGARNGNGDVTVTFASSYNDPYSVAGAFSVRHARATLIHTAAGRVVAEKATATTVRLRAFNAAGAALSDARILLAVG